MQTCWARCLACRHRPRSRNRPTRWRWKTRSAPRPARGAQGPLQLRVFESRKYSFEGISGDSAGIGMIKTAHSVRRWPTKLRTALTVVAICLGSAGTASAQADGEATRHDWTGALADQERFSFAPGLRGSRYVPRSVASPALSPATDFPSVLRLDRAAPAEQPNADPYSPSTPSKRATSDKSGRDFEGTTTSASKTLTEAAPVPERSSIEPETPPPPIPAVAKSDTDRMTPEDTAPEAVTAALPKDDALTVPERSPETPAISPASAMEAGPAERAAPPPVPRALGGPQQAQSRGQTPARLPTANRGQPSSDTSIYDGWFDPTPDWAKRAFGRP